MDTGNFDGLTNIWEAFERSHKRIPNSRFLGTRNPNKEGKPYEWKTFAEVRELLLDFA